jgi:tape measure domain-containing protein
MPGTLNAGSIIYEVDMDTAKLLAARRQVDAALNGMGGSMGRLEASVNRTERSVASMQRTMSSLTGVAKGLIAALSVQQIASYADAWTELNNKLSNSLRAGEQQVDVMQRIFDISQATQSSLNATATLYSRLERGTRAYNTSAQDLTRLTTIINQGFGVSGATAQEAENAIIQLSQGIASGVLRGEEFNSVSEQGSRLAIALADSLGVGLGQLRAMAAQGKLTTDVIVNGLLSQGDKIGQEFAKTTVSISKGLLVAGNNITKFFGENTTVQSFAIGFRDSVIAVSENLEILSGALIALAGVMGSRYVAALTMATAAKVKDTVASVAASKAAAVAAKDAELEAAAKLRLTQVEKAATIQALQLAEGRLATMRATQASVASEVQLAQAEANSIRLNIQQIESEKALEAQRLRAQITEQGRIATATRMAQLQQASVALNARLAAAEAVTATARATSISAAEAQVSSARIAAADATGVATAANARYIASQEAAAVAASAASTSAGVLRGALSLVGGPAGAAFLAGAALFYFFQKAQQAKQESIDFADKLDGVISRMKEMNQVQLGAEIAKAQQSIIDQGKNLDDLRESVSELKSEEAEYQGLASKFGYEGGYATKLADIRRKVAIATGEVDTAETKLSQTISKVGILRAQMNGTLVTGIDLLKRDGEAAGVAAGLMNQFGTALNIANRAKDKFNSTSLEIPRSEKADEFNKQLEDENALLAITDKRLRAVTKARMEATQKGGNVNQVNSAGDLAAQQYDLQEAEKSRTNATKETAKAESQAERAEKRRQKSLKELTDQAAVAELQFRGLKREAAQLSAIQDLDAGASAQQIERASQQAGQIFDIQQRAADKKAALEQDSLANASRQRDLDLAQVQRQLAAGDISFEQSQKRRADIAASYSEQIAQANAKSAVTPQQAAAATVDPVQALANENAQKLALIQQFENQKVLTEQQSLALRNSLNLQYDQQRTTAMWTMWRNQSAGNEAVAASFDSLAGNASNAFTGMVTGSMTAEEAMSSLASNAINSLINSFVQMGAEWVKSAVMGAAAQTTAVATTTAASVAGTATTTAASTTAAGTTLAAWTPAALVASIGSFGGAAVVGLAALLGVMALSGSIAGKRKNGGPVSAGSMYQVGEGGMPEIYRASNGSQYMIPGDNGSVISNKDLSSGGGSASASGGVVINIQNYTSATVDAQTSNDGNGVTIDVIVADLNQGGRISNALTSNFQAPRKTRG